MHCDLSKLLVILLQFHELLPHYFLYFLRHARPLFLHRSRLLMMLLVPGIRAAGPQQIILSLQVFQVVLQFLKFYAFLVEHRVEMVARVVVPSLILPIEYLPIVWIRHQLPDVLSLVLALIGGWPVIAGLLLPIGVVSAHWTMDEFFGSVGTVWLLLFSVNFLTKQVPFLRLLASPAD